LVEETVVGAATIPSGPATIQTDGGDDSEGAGAISRTDIQLDQAPTLHVAKLWKPLAGSKHSGSLCINKKRYAAGRMNLNVLVPLERAATGGAKPFESLRPCAKPVQAADVGALVDGIALKSTILPTHVTYTAAPVSKKKSRAQMVFRYESCSILRIPKCKLIPGVGDEFSGVTPMHITSNIRADDVTDLQTIEYLGDDREINAACYDHVPDELRVNHLAEVGELVSWYVFDKHIRGYRSPDNDVGDGESSVFRPGQAPSFDADNRAVQECAKVICSVLDVPIKDVLSSFKDCHDHAYHQRVKEFALARSPIENARFGDEPMVSRLRGSGIPQYSYNRSYQQRTGLFMEGTSYTEIVENFRDFYCRICGIFDCQTLHGLFHVQPWERVDPAPPPACQFPGISVPTDAYRASNRRKQIGQSGGSSDNIAGSVFSGNGAMATTGGVGVGNAAEALGAAYFSSEAYLSVCHPAVFTRPEPTTELPVGMYRDWLPGDNDPGSPLLPLEKSLLMKLVAVYGVDSR